MGARGSAVRTLALRFLYSKSSDGFLSFISSVSMAGIALGVLSLVVVTSVINGFEGELTKAISGLNGHVVLYSRADPVSDGNGIEKKIRGLIPEALGVSQSLITQLMASGPDGVAGLVLEGIDPKTASQVTALEEKLISGRLPIDAGEVALASTVAEKLGVKTGNPIRMIIPSFGEEGSGAPKVLDAKISGIVRMGLHEYDTKYAFGKIDWVQSIVGLPGKVSTFKIKLKDPGAARDVSNKLSENFGYPFRAKDWSQLNRNLFYAIQLEKAVIAIILTVIILVAAFNVVSTLMMMIRDKTKEMSILKAMGLRRSETFQLFAMIGLTIGAVGIAIGIAAGLVLNFILFETKLITLPADIYYIGFLPVSVNASEIGLIAILALFIVLLAALYPSLRASTQSPMDGIRFE